MIFQALNLTMQTMMRGVVIGRVHVVVIGGGGDGVVGGGDGGGGGVHPPLLLVVLSHGLQN